MQLSVAAVHASPVFMDTAASVDKAISYIDLAGSRGLDLIVFPEVFLPGYPFFIDCYPPRSQDVAIAAYQAASVEADGPELHAIRLAAKRNNVAVVMGMSERLPKTTTCFNSQAFIDRDGSLLGVHRKLQPTYAERMVWGQGGGATLRVYDSSLGRLGGLVCYEHTMNLARQSLIEQHEQIHAGAWPSLSTLTGLEKTIDSQIEALSKTHALTAQAFVIVAGHPIDQGTLDWMESNLGPQSDAKLGGGWSAIIHPQTVYVADPHTGSEEKLVEGVIDLADVPRLKVWVDANGHYSRPEVVSMTTDRKALWPDEVVAETRGGAAPLSSFAPLLEEPSLSQLG